MKKRRRIKHLSKHSTNKCLCL